MKIVLLASVCLLLAVAAIPSAAAAEATVIGGGTGTFDADLDGDGDIDGSQFAVIARLRADGSARGHFECLMAGRSDFLGLAVMAVEGRIHAGSMHPDGSVTLQGTGSVNLGKGEMVRGVSFTVTFVPGGPGTGRLTLTVIGAFDGVPGDALAGNGNYDLPAETVVSGRIAILGG